MKISDDEPRGERLIRALAVAAGCAIVVAFALATIKLIVWLQASASSVNTVDAVVAAFALCGLVIAGLVARYIFERGSEGARRVCALLTETAPGKIFGGLVGLLLAIASISTLTTADGWGSWVVSILSMMFWAAVGLRELRNGCRQWTSQGEALRNGPAIERIPE
ncbi:MULTISPECIES: hypothetical protein [unclassified Mycobacterium avium complex (MAC)]|jgi:hypothetical protein|uniref:hypothetical protein n=1 Tax=unclassified Mycobacterium avium complex (MAC) TaxID=2750822 RepID=UPI000534DAC0|nr:MULTISPECIES: hypothetical protein [unclassified Mycobacterium avium complex (MAC)]